MAAHVRTPAILNTNGHPLHAWILIFERLHGTKGNARNYLAPREVALRPTTIAPHARHRLPLEVSIA